MLSVSGEEYKVNLSANADLAVVVKLKKGGIEAELLIK